MRADKNRSTASDDAPRNFTLCMLNQHIAYTKEPFLPTLLLATQPRKAHAAPRKRDFGPRLMFMALRVHYPKSWCVQRGLFFPVSRSAFQRGGTKPYYAEIHGPSGEARALPFLENLVSLSCS
jgi:hypothetical protein